MRRAPPSSPAPHPDPPVPRAAPGRASSRADSLPPYSCCCDKHCLSPHWLPLSWAVRVTGGPVGRIIPARGVGGTWGAELPRPSCSLPAPGNNRKPIGHSQGPRQHPQVRLPLKLKITNSRENEGPSPALTVTTNFPPTVPSMLCGWKVPFRPRRFVKKRRKKEYM